MHFIHSVGSYSRAILTPGTRQPGCWTTFYPPTGTGSRTLFFDAACCTLARAKQLGGRKKRPSEVAVSSGKHCASSCRRLRGHPMLPISDARLHHHRACRCARFGIDRAAPQVWVGGWRPRSSLLVVGSCHRLLPLAHVIERGTGGATWRGPPLPPGQSLQSVSNPLDCHAPEQETHLVVCSDAFPDLARREHNC